MYVKLFSSILDSSVWDESPATRLVWITMLCMADEEGFVRGTASAIARRAVVRPDEAETALAVLEAPDPRSHTTEHEGRRIAPVDGGWMVLNYGAYREMQTRKQAKDAERQARKRQRDNALNRQSPVESVAVTVDVRDMSRPSRDVTTIASASVSEGSCSSVVRARGKILWANTDHEEAYVTYCQRREPAAVDAVLRGIHTPLAGRGYAWCTIGQALVEMYGADATFSAQAVRRFCEKLERDAEANESPAQRSVREALAAGGAR